MPPISFVRIVAAATLTYSSAITVRPRLLARPAGLLGAGGEMPVGTEALIRSIGTRDAALAALLLSGRGHRSVTLTAAKAVSDAADTVWFSLLPVPASSRAKVAGVAAAWSLLELFAWRLDRERMLRGASIS